MFCNLHGHYKTKNYFDDFDQRLTWKKLCQWKMQRKITHMWRRWGTLQNFFLAFIDELEKQIIITPLWTQKIKILKKWKKYLKILSFYKHKWQSYDQALSRDFQYMCSKMHALILLDVWWCAMSIFLFLKYYNFIKEIMRIHSIFKKPEINVFILHLLTF